MTSSSGRFVNRPPQIAAAFTVAPPCHRKRAIRESPLRTHHVIAIMKEHHYSVEIDGSTCCDSGSTLMKSVIG